MWCSQNLSSHFVHVHCAYHVIMRFWRDKISIKSDNNSIKWFKQHFTQYWKTWIIIFDRYIVWVITMKSFDVLNNKTWNVLKTINCFIQLCEMKMLIHHGSISHVYAKKGFLLVPSSIHHRSRSNIFFSKMATYFRSWKGSWFKIKYLGRSVYRVC